MYEAFFKLSSRPFVSTPDTRCYFPATLIENARQTLVRLIERGEGPGLVIGPPGTGKTLLCHLLAEHFRDTFAVSMLGGGRLRSCRVLLQTILYELGLPCRGMDEGDLRLNLLDALEPKDGSRGLLLLVDEAHALPWRLLEEVRLMTNLVRDGQPRVRVVLSGNPALEERFASPKLASFAQRVAGRCYLEPLDCAETSRYVLGQLQNAGGVPEKLIDEDALKSVYRATDGVPRLVNQVCDHALVLASLGGRAQLNSQAIEEAWADLQQLPVPWRGGATEVTGGIVEFGGLSDDNDLPEAIPFRGCEPETPLHVAEPEEQLDAIEEHISSLAEEGRPAEASSEVDLDFPEFGDPFNEQFAEEEVVLNPHRSDMEIFADVPRVSCWEGHQLGAMLKTLGPLAPEVSPRPNVTLSWPPMEADEAHDVGEETQSAPAAHVQPEEPPAPRKTEPLERLSGGQSDRDVIVVEEGSDAAHARMERAAKAEFRQLFRRLRHG